MNEQRFPGFTAEASFHRTTGRYVAPPAGASFSSREVLPQLSVFDRECYELCTAFFSGFGNVTPYDCRRLCTHWVRHPSDYGMIVSPP
jgi:hypothetical protein